MEKAKDRLEHMVRGAEILVLSTHDEKVVQSWCTRVLWLDQGRIVDDGPPADVLTNHLGHPVEPIDAVQS
jgi:lipopolysaccharide transport system ATP-binding protein